MRSLLVLAALVTEIPALICFDQTTDGSVPDMTTVCSDNTTQCFKYTGKIGGPKASVYGCDDPITGNSICDGINSGSCSPGTIFDAPVNICCCSGDECNSSGVFELLIPVMVAIFVRLLSVDLRS